MAVGLWGKSFSHTELSHDQLKHNGFSYSAAAANAAAAAAARVLRQMSGPLNWPDTQQDPYRT